MPIPRPVHHCPICGDKISGRKDKIYCSQECKTEYHNRRKKQILPISSEINKILYRNWVILQELYESIEKKKFFVAKSKLTQLGFKFNYYTTTHVNKEGKLYKYVYNFGWMDFSEKELMVLHLNKPK